MYRANSFSQSLAAESVVPTKHVTELVSVLLQIVHSYSSLTERRSATLEWLAKQFGARAGHWAWGCGDVLASNVQPVAIVTFGYEPQELAVISQMGLDSEVDRTLRLPILEKLSGGTQSIDSRLSIFSDEVWENTVMRRYLLRIQADEWLHAVRYESLNNWSNMFFIRSEGQPPFEDVTERLLEVCMAAIPWLHASELKESEAPGSPIVKLTDRQRTVMLLLLDGLSRKEIASSLGITEETVGDHIKQIYIGFKVNSAVELAAIFLRNR